ncbi:MAG: Uma2 family endonuclease [Oscillatoriales cyanobacterium RU_3_3]|nr:Uma2 family endonuclease [Microcoleus sp. SU_5_6]NJM61312.1 Uma2 family endonuclease [Oscillatoriales cyanobacterium RU_3_3]NJR21240.1 Uma2 family endonuclease [Richelia sp. CSU_2_1]
MLVKTQPKLYTPDEYRQLEETAEFKNEYRDGEIVQMTGGTINHSRIIRNLSRVLGNAIEGTAFELFQSDLRLWIPRYRRGTYPDVMAIEGEPVFTEGRNDEILNPILIVEVLSKSTKNFDLDDKFRLYRSIPEFREYVLVSQYEFLVQQYVKNESNQWLFSEYEGEAATVSFDSVGVQMPASEIYKKVVFATEETAVTE